MTLSATFLDKVKYVSQDFRAQFADFIGNGVVSLSHFPISYSNPANMNVTIGSQSINSVAWCGYGFRIADNAVPTSLTVPSADPTYPRIDIVQIGINPIIDSNNDTTGTPTIQIKKGVAQASPIEPGADPGFVKIYAINVPANATQISASNVTDRRSLVPLNISGSQINYQGAASISNPNTFSANQTLSSQGNATESQSFGSFELGFTRSNWTGTTHQEKTSFLQVDANGKLNFINEAGSSVWSLDQNGNRAGIGALTFDPNLNIFTAVNAAAGTSWTTKGKNGNNDFQVFLDGTHKVQTFNNVVDDGTGKGTFAGLLTSSVGVASPTTVSGFKNLIDPTRLNVVRGSIARKSDGIPVQSNIIRLEPGVLGSGMFVEEGATNILYDSDFVTITGTNTLMTDNLTASTAWTTRNGSFTYSASGATSGAAGSQLTAGNSAWKPLIGSNGTALSLTVQATFTMPSTVPTSAAFTLYLWNTGSNVYEFWSNGSASTLSKTVSGTYTGLTTGSQALTANATYTATLSITPSGQLTAKLYSGTGTGGTLLQTLTATDTSLSGGFLIGCGGDTGVVISNASVTGPLFDTWALQGGTNPNFTPAINSSDCITAGYSASIVQTNAGGGSSSTGGVFVNAIAPLTNGQQYTVSFWAKSISGNTSLHSELWGSTGGQNFTLTNYWQRFVYHPTAGTQNGVYFWLQGAGSCLIDAVQVETATHPTSVISNPSTSGSMTKAADSVWFSFPYRKFPASHFGAMYWTPAYNSTEYSDKTLVWTINDQATAWRHVLHYVGGSFNLGANATGANVVSVATTFNAGDKIFVAWKHDPANSILKLWIGINGGTLQSATVTDANTFADIYRMYVGCRDNTGTVPSGGQGQEATGTYDLPLISDYLPTDDQVQALYTSKDWGGVHNAFLQNMFNTDIETSGYIRALSGGAIGPNGDLNIVPITNNYLDFTWNTYWTVNGWASRNGGPGVRLGMYGGTANSAMFEIDGSSDVTTLAPGTAFGANFKKWFSVTANGTGIYGASNFIAVGTDANPASSGKGGFSFCSNGTTGTDGAYLEYVPPTTGSNTANRVTISSGGSGLLTGIRLAAQQVYTDGYFQPGQFYFGNTSVTGTSTNSPVVPASSQGYYLGWNQNSGTGTMEIMNAHGTGQGGFNFWEGAQGSGTTWSKVAWITASGQGYFNGTYATSDERLKTDIRPIENALDKVTQIHGVHFRWNEKYLANKSEEHKEQVDVPQVGIIAQEVEKVLPEAVQSMGIHFDEETDYKSVDYARLVPLLIEAIKELNDKVEALSKGRD